LMSPCGPIRLKIVELILALVRCVAEDEDADELTTAIATTIANANAFASILDVFAEYPYNNLLHGLVEGVIHTVLDIPDQEETMGSPACILLRKNLFGNANLLTRIVDLFGRNAEALTQRKGTRLGFMGHLIRMTSVLRASYAPSTLAHLGVSVEGINKWEQFLDTVFKPEIITQQIVLGGHRPGVPPAASEADDSQDVDGLQLEGMLENDDAFRNPYQTGQFDDDDDDDLFNWDSRDPQLGEVDSDDDDAMLQDIAPTLSMEDLIVSEDTPHM